jgi:molybdenum cofactor synthesis domain-containing protein
MRYPPVSLHLQGRAMARDTITAGMVVIGDEILSGRTKDKNIGYVAEYLTQLGIELKEVRVVSDDEPMIVEAVNTLRARYTYVFTSGGIGPTHDDITADAVAAAFGTVAEHDPRAVALLQARYKPEELTEARLRMARLPKGATLVDNPISKAPGFRMDNVIVMAGVPSIMQAMLDAVTPELRSGVKMLSTSLDAGGLPEGVYGTPLAAIAKAHPGTSIGSYPSFTGTGFKNQIVVRSKDEDRMLAAADAVSAMLAELTNTDKNPL